jgi:ankyrin repeat protein
MEGLASVLDRLISKNTLDDFIRTLDDNPFDVNTEYSQNNWRLIYSAIGRERWDFVRLLLDRGATLKDWYVWDRLVLHDAPKDVLERCIRQFLNNDINVLKAGHTFSSDNMAMIHHAGHHPQVTKDLLDIGANVNLKSSLGWLPIDWVLFSGDPSTAIILLQSGSNQPNIDRMKHGDQPYLSGNGNHCTRALNRYYQHIEPRLVLLALGQLIDVPRQKRSNWLSRDLLRMVGDCLLAQIV